MLFQMMDESHENLRLLRHAFVLCVLLGILDNELDGS
jgi:hypothetical protein